MRETRLPISIVVPTLNSGVRLNAALDSVRWADDVIVIDGGSTDDTLAIARSRGARVIHVDGPTIGAQRNAGIATARHHWILALDSDETVTTELRDSLARLTADPAPTHEAFRIRSQNWYLGRELRHGPWGRDWKIRVFTRDQRFTDARVHENIRVASGVGFLPGDLVHHPYDDLAHHVVKIAKYASWAARDMSDRGRQASVMDMLARPAARFVRDYVLFSGWRDGRAGFIVATTSAFSVFCKYASLLLARDAPDLPARSARRSVVAAATSPTR